MSKILPEAFFILVLILLNGIFAMSEIAIVSARKTRLRQLADDHPGARKALDLAESPNRFLSTVQIGITLVGIFAGAFGGATIAAQLSDWLARYPTLEPVREEISFGIVVLAITYLSLILGELVPKRVALQNPEHIASRVAGPMRLLSKAASPLVSLLSASTDLVLRGLGIRETKEPPVTEEEISVLLAEGARTGVLLQSEREIVERVFRFADQSVGAIMVPRTEMTYLELDDPPEKTLMRIIEEPDRQFVVCKGGLDNTIGIVDSHDLLAQCLRGEPPDLLALLHQPPYVPESVPALHVLERFRESGDHLALIIDEYGGVAGMVTLSDILDAIVGDIPEFGETVQPDIVQRDDGSYLVEGMLTISELKDFFDFGELPGERTGAFRTVGGFVITTLGRIPTAAESFTWNGFRFEVADMDGNRVDKVLIIPEAGASSPS